jgi:pimeloyl-ACP methyl ester carboxylesterase
MATRLRVSGRLTSGGLVVGVRRWHPGISHCVHVAQPRQQYTVPRLRTPRSTAIGQPHHGHRMFAIDADVSTTRPTVNVAASTRLRVRSTGATVKMMDPLLLAGAAGLAGYGYLRPTDVFRGALAARLRVGGIRSQRVRLPRAEVRYWSGGNGEPVVFVHGFGTEASLNWHGQLPALRRRFQVIAPDLPGFGASERVGGDSVIAFHVECLRDLVTHLGLSSVHLVGHSMGGWISLAFAATYPELVSRLVVIDAAGLNFEADLSLQRVLLPENAADVRDLLAANFQKPPRLPKFVIRDVLRTCRREATARTEVLRQLVYGAEFLDERLSRIVAPTLIVWGRADIITPLAIGERLAAGIANAELLVFDDCAHSPNIECPARCNAALVEFLSGRELRRSPRSAALAANG